MAAPDDSALKALIASNIPDATPTQQRRITASFLRSVLTTLVDWVKSAINTNLTTWLRASDGQPGGANTDAIYREGSLEIRGGGVFKTRTSTNATLGAVAFGNFHAIQLYGMNGGPAFMEFHLPGLCIHQLGVDTDGILKFHPWTSTSAYPVLISGSSDTMALSPALSNRKISLYGFATNEHQFFGFGVNSNVLRYQIGGPTSAHIFYAGASPATSLELMRITGDGRVGIGISPAGYTALDVASGWASFHGNMAGHGPGNGIGISLGWNYSGGQAESSIVYGVQDWPAAFLNFCSWNGVAMSEKMRLDSNGNLGINTNAPTSLLHLKAPAGYPQSQLRLETSFTPTGSGDNRGNVGDIAWDQNYTYVKTAIGWRRSALASW